MADTNSGLVGGGAKTIQPKFSCCHTERGHAFANFGNSKIPILTELALARVEVEAACSQEDQPLGVV